MNHKRKRPKNSRSGCLMCKANKMSGGHTFKLGHTGFGKLRSEAHALDDSRINLAWGRLRATVDYALGKTD